jgi:SNF2 family DNA or RNA helicase
MGMGKSIQVASLISVLFRKTGTKEDKRLIRLKQLNELYKSDSKGKDAFFTSKLFPEKTATTTSSSTSSNLNQTTTSSSSACHSQYSPLELDYISTKPVLIICPKSLIDNWKNEINRWGYFSLTILSSSLKDDEISSLIDNANQNKFEILLISYSQISKYYLYLKKIGVYSLIIYDEGHKLKNSKSQLFQQISLIKKKCSCNIILSGTPIQNDLKELWSLLALISTKGFIDKSLFIKEIEKPIKLGMSSAANEKTIAMATKAREELLKILDKCLLVRKKTLLQEKKVKKKSEEKGKKEKQAITENDKKERQEITENVKKIKKNQNAAKNRKNADREVVDEDEDDNDDFIDENNDEKDEERPNEMLLKGKDEIIVLCDLSPLQKQMYEYCLSLPDFDNVRFHALPCPCGSGVPRGQCCLEYQIPLIRDNSGNVIGERKIKYVTDQQKRKIDPRAILWRQFHENDQPCQYSGHLDAIVPSASKKGGGGSGCPLCVLLPCLNKLNKIACHPMLLQSDPKKMSQSKVVKAEEFLSKAFTPEMVANLGGLQRSYRLMDMKQSIEDSGKMKTLREMLFYFINHQEKTLVFSLSTQVLDILETLFLCEGWKYYRLDGQTPMKKRQQLVDQFNANNNKQPSSSEGSTTSTAMNRSDNVFVFLISSRAGGLGLNLNTASKVIIFDVDWNPIVDMQSQDRAYRIGQKEHVTVYRLVSKGTVEEVSVQILFIFMKQLNILLLFFSLFLFSSWHT